MDPGLDQVGGELGAEALDPPVRHDHLDPLARGHSVQQHLLHQLGVGVGQDHVTGPDLLVGSLRDGFRMQGEIVVYKVVNDGLDTLFQFLYRNISTKALVFKINKFQEGKDRLSKTYFSNCLASFFRCLIALLIEIDNWRH